VPPNRDEEEQAACLQAHLQHKTLSNELSVSTQLANTDAFKVLEQKMIRVHAKVRNAILKAIPAHLHKTVMRRQPPRPNTTTLAPPSSESKAGMETATDGVVGVQPPPLTSSDSIGTDQDLREWVLPHQAGGRCTLNTLGSTLIKSLHNSLDSTPAPEPFRGGKSHVGLETLDNTLPNASADDAVDAASKGCIHTRLVVFGGSMTWGVDAVAPAFRPMCPGCADPRKPSTPDASRDFKQRTTSNATMQREAGAKIADTPAAADHPDSSTDGSFNAWPLLKDPEVPEGLNKFANEPHCCAWPNFLRRALTETLPADKADWLTVVNLAVPATSTGWLKNQIASLVDTIPGGALSECDVVLMDFSVNDADARSLYEDNEDNLVNALVDVHDRLAPTPLIVLQAYPFDRRQDRWGKRRTSADFSYQRAYQEAGRRRPSMLVVDLASFWNDAGVHVDMVWNSVSDMI
jgi:hypothetical protein